MAVTANKDSIQAFSNSINDIVKSVEGLDEKTIRWNPTEEEWSILQVITHLNEAIPYWISEVDRVVAEPGSKWGRGLVDADRVAAVATPDELNIEEELTTLKGLQQQVTEHVSHLSEAQLNAENPHRNFERFGNKPVSFIIDHFITEHANTHYGQIQRNLSKLD